MTEHDFDYLDDDWDDNEEIATFPPIDPGRLCLTCKQPVSAHKGFQCPEQEGPAG